MNVVAFPTVGMEIHFPIRIKPRRAVLIRIRTVHPVRHSWFLHFHLDLGVVQEGVPRLHTRTQSEVHFAKVVFSQTTEENGSGRENGSEEGTHKHDNGDREAAQHEGEFVVEELTIGEKKVMPQHSSVRKKPSEKLEEKENIRICSFEFKG